MSKDKQRKPRKGSFKEYWAGAETRLLQFNWVIDVARDAFMAGRKSTRRKTRATKQ